MGGKRKSFIITCHQDGQGKEAECRRDKSGGQQELFIFDMLLYRSGKTCKETRLGGITHAGESVC